MELVDAPPMDEKAKRTRDLLASFYAQDSSASSGSTTSSTGNMSSLDSINSSAFDPDKYMNHLVHKSSLEGLVQKHIQMATEIKNLDTDLQMLVYENYNKFISATDTIKRMKNNIVGMEANMEQLLDKIISVQTKSDTVNTSLFEKREHIEKLHRTRSLLRKIQFIYDLPTRLGKCIKSEAYTDAVRFFIGAKPIFEAYGGSSFQDCKKASEEAMNTVIENLQAKLSLDSEPIEARAEAVVLLKHLNFPVDDLKIKLLDKLEDLLSGLKTSSQSKVLDPTETGDLNVSRKENILESIPLQFSNESLASIGEYSKTIRAYRIIFPESEERLVELSHELFMRHFQTIEECMLKRMSSAELLSMLRNIWNDVTLMDEVLPEAALPIFSFEEARGVIKKYISSTFSFLLLEISGAVTSGQNKPKDGLEEFTLQTALENSKKAVIQGTMGLLLNFRLLLDDNLDVLVKFRDLIIDWVQEGFQKFFHVLEKNFLMLSGKSYSNNHDFTSVDGTRPDRVQTKTILLLAQLSLFIEQTAIPRITEEIAASFSGGSVRGYEYGPAFVPGEICRIFHSAGENLLDLYINMKTQKISVILKTRFTTPNWIKHKEPREVHMFVDLLLQELGAVAAELKQILPHSLIQRQKHLRSESVGSTNSARSNLIHEDKIVGSNSQRARNQLLESHLAKLFEQKMEIFTKVEFTHVSHLNYE
ncbi:Fat-free-like protein [Zostera marina]|uniref:Vacuolar protein sorting-associated protein 51 homolog n=1 Tax=Zostera marina TaxID=29655 RepID=A0A0K9P633_ZOSMR|nr:Fat-free-like protein [Zostera marina]